MGLNSKVTSRAFPEVIFFGFGGCFLITWMNEGGNLKTWADLIAFGFITKVVGNLVVLTGLNTYFANKTFRDPNLRTRNSDYDENENKKPNTDVLDVINRRK